MSQIVDQYAALPSEEISYVNSIFQQPWWLETIVPGQWHEIVVRRGGEIIARLPYVVKKKWGLTLLTMPTITQTLGPWLKALECKYTKQLSFQKEVMTELIEQLPQHDYFFQNFHYSITNWLPFHWRGFSQETGYTYVIEDLTNLGRIWEGMSSAVRAQIRKADKSGIKVVDTDDIDAFIDLCKKTFGRQGLSFPYSMEFIRHLDRECKRRDARKIFIAYGPDGRAHSGIFCVFDKNAMYNLMQGSDPNLRSSGANSLLIWETIKFATNVSRVFDFEGSMQEKIESFFRDFGAFQKPYLKISRVNSYRMSVLLSGQRFLKSIINK